MKIEKLPHAITDKINISDNHCDHVRLKYKINEIIDVLNKNEQLFIESFSECTTKKYSCKKEKSEINLEPPMLCPFCVHLPVLKMSGSNYFFECTNINCGGTTKAVNTIAEATKIWNKRSWKQN